MEIPGAYIYEVFSGIQGEGLHVGERDLFIRFCRCNLTCPFCDTPYALKDSPTCLMEKKAGERDFVPLPNPLSPFSLLDNLRPLLNPPNLHHSIVLTGGEPLLWVYFLQVLLPQLRQFNLPITLETNGTLAFNLQKVVQWVDIISMDFKLPSCMGGKRYWETHKRFLSVAKQKRVFVKVVVSSQTTLEEIEKAVSIIEEEGDIPLVIQPVSAQGGYAPPSEGELLKMQEKAKERISQVRVIPQMHKFLGLK